MAWSRYQWHTYTVLKRYFSWFYIIFPNTDCLTNHFISRHHLVPTSSILSLKLNFQFTTEEQNRRRIFVFSVQEKTLYFLLIMIFFLYTLSSNICIYSYTTQQTLITFSTDFFFCFFSCASLTNFFLLLADYLFSRYFLWFLCDHIAT